MINALDKKINALAARHSWHISPRAGDGLHWYEVAPMDRPGRDPAHAGPVQGPDRGNVGTVQPHRMGLRDPRI